MRLIPRRPVPSLSVPLVGGGLWTLAERRPASFAMVVFYRGLHCPVCSRYLADLDRRLDAFEAQGVDTVAVSTDPLDRAAEAKRAWKLERLAVGYGLPIAEARAWGLYVSAGIGKTSTGIEEPAEFAEPGLFLIRPDGTLYWGSIQTMPFARPSFAEVLAALEIVRARNYPARGELG